MRGGDVEGVGGDIDILADYALHGAGVGVGPGGDHGCVVVSNTLIPGVGVGGGVTGGDDRWGGDGGMAGGVIVGGGVITGGV